MVRLGDDAGRRLSLAAVIGREFDVDLLAEFAEVDEARVIDVCDAATRAALAHPVEGGRDH